MHVLVRGGGGRRVLVGTTGERAGANVVVLVLVVPPCSPTHVSGGVVRSPPTLAWPSEWEGECKKREVQGV
jgi:hypothetical protein